MFDVSYSKFGHLRRIALLACIVYSVMAFCIVACGVQALRAVGMAVR